MNTQDLASGSDEAKRRISLVGLTLALGFAIVLAGAWFGGNWLIDDYGRPIANDFVDVWAAGHLALDGHAAAAYDWQLHKAAEVAAVGHDFDNYYGWHYPPTFFFVAAPLALLPYTAAAVVWLGATLAAYVAAICAHHRQAAPGFWSRSALPPCCGTRAPGRTAISPRR